MALLSSGNVGIGTTSPGAKLDISANDGTRQLQLTYNGYVDKQWVLFEYDAKNNKLSYVIDMERLVSGKKHKLELYVSDERKNISIFRSGFTF